MATWASCPHEKDDQQEARKTSVEKAEDASLTLSECMSVFLFSSPPPLHFFSCDSYFHAAGRGPCGCGGFAGQEVFQESPFQDALLLGGPGYVC